uniref:Uncharacterized protein n=1 Tax=Arundo donax TaxID=35708 RepID=A0A0A9EDL0_ARUDO
MTNSTFPSLPVKKSFGFATCPM